MKILDCEVCQIARLSPQFPTIQHREQEYPVLPTAFLFSVSSLPVLPVWPLFPLTDTVKQPSIEFVCPDCFLSLSCPVLEDWRNGNTVEIRTDSLALWVGLTVGRVHLERTEHTSTLLCEGQLDLSCPLQMQGSLSSETVVQWCQTPSTQYKDAKKTTPHYAKTTTLVFVESLPT